MIVNMSLNPYMMVANNTSNDVSLIIIIIIKSVTEIVDHLLKSRLYLCALQI